MNYVVDIDRVKAYFNSMPSELPPHDTLLEHNAAHTDMILWPLLSRRNLKRLLILFRNLSAKQNSEVTASCNELTRALLDLPDRHIQRLVTQPEVTSWITNSENDPDTAVNLLPHLAGSIVAEVGLAGQTCGPVKVGAVSPHGIRFREAGVEYISEQPIPEFVSCHVKNGVIFVEIFGKQIEVSPGGTGVERVHDANGIKVATFPYSWVGELRDDADIAFWDLHDDISQPAQTLKSATEIVDEVWPEAWAELSVMLRWAVPMKVTGSFNIPGFRGLISVGTKVLYRTAQDIVHEGSHNKLSTIMELADVSRNPDELVHSPFINEKGPASSLIHSCWSFARELQFLHRMHRRGYVNDERHFISEERKFYAFFRLAFPVIHKEIDLTPLGSALMESIEQVVASSTPVGKQRVR